MKLPLCVWIVSCLFVCIVMVIACYLNRHGTMNCLEYFNPPVLLKLFFGKFNLCSTSQDQNKINFRSNEFKNH